MTATTTTRTLTIEAPIGTVEIEHTEDAVVRVRVHGTPGAGASAEAPGAAGREAARQLRAYFEGRLERFDLPLAAHGTPFQRSVWSALEAIPFGQTRTYGALAVELGSPRGARAVGAANGRNPLPLVVPCHRVVAAGGLGGYGLGIERKRWLLEHERTVLARHARA